MGLTQGLVSTRICVSWPLAQEETRLVLTQGVAAVQKRDGSELRGLIFSRPFALTRAQGLFRSPSFPALHVAAAFPLRNTVASLLPCHAAAEISPGHCMAKEGREGRWVLLTSSFSIISMSRKLRKVGPHSAIQLRVLFGHSISPVHPGCFTASKAGVRREVCGCELYPHFCSALLRFPLCPVNSSEKSVMR